MIQDRLRNSSSSRVKPWMFRWLPLALILQYACYKHYEQFGHVPRRITVSAFVYMQAGMSCWCRTYLPVLTEHPSMTDADILCQS